MARGREVVAPGQTIASDWGNDVWDQSVQTFANDADRAAQWPDITPGALTYVEDDQRWDLTGGAVTVPLAQLGGWDVLAVTLGQPGPISGVDAQGGQYRMGGLAWGFANVAVIAPGASGNIVLQLPAPAADFDERLIGGQAIGSFSYFRAGVTIYAGTTQISSGSQLQFQPNGQGNQLGGDFAAKVGDTMSCTWLYPVKRNTDT